MTFQSLWPAQASILRRRRRLYDCWPLKGALIAIVKSQTRDLSTISSALSEFRHPLLPCRLQAACIEPRILLELPNFYCLPGEPGELPVGLERIVQRKLNGRE
jgi:GAF domain-containing protein